MKDGEGGDGPLENQEPVKEVVNEPQCVNEGCSNPPVDSEDRGPLFCSNECLVLHCRYVRVLSFLAMYAYVHTYVM